MNTRDQINIILIGLFFLPILGYAAYQARFIVQGPRIWIDSPKNGQTVTEPLVIITGRAQNVAWISINDRQIFTDEHGNWTEKLLVAKGISIITVTAYDRFGRETHQTLQLFLPTDKI